MICNGVPERETELTLQLHRNPNLNLPTGVTVRPLKKDDGFVGTVIFYYFNTAGALDRETSKTWLGLPMYFEKLMELNGAIFNPASETLAFLMFASNLDTKLEYRI